MVHLSLVRVSAILDNDLKIALMRMQYTQFHFRAVSFTVLLVYRLLGPISRLTVLQQTACQNSVPPQQYVSVVEGKRAQFQDGNACVGKRALYNVLPKTLYIYLFFLQDMSLYDLIIACRQHFQRKSRRIPKQFDYFIILPGNIS